MSTRNESYLVGLIGDGITQSLTPPMHEAEADRHGLRYLYRPVDLGVIGRPGTSVGDLLRAGRDLGFNAFNITHPCKQLVLEHLDEIDPRAEAIQAVNTVLIREGKFIGYNTDCSGFTTGFGHGLPGVTVGSVVQFGSGGAGSAVAEALLSLGAQRLCLVDVDVARAAERANSPPATRTRWWKPSRVTRPRITSRRPTAWSTRPRWGCTITPGRLSTWVCCDRSTGSRT